MIWPGWRARPFSCSMASLRALLQLCFVLLHVYDVGVGIPALLLEFLDRHHAKHRLVEDVVQQT